MFIILNILLIRLRIKIQSDSGKSDYLRKCNCRIRPSWAYWHEVFRIPGGPGRTSQKESRPRNHGRNITTHRAVYRPGQNSDLWKSWMTKGRKIEDWSGLQIHNRRDGVSGKDLIANPVPTAPRRFSMKWHIWTNWRNANPVVMLSPWIGKINFCRSIGQHIKLSWKLLDLLAEYLYDWADL